MITCGIRTLFVYFHRQQSGVSHFELSAVMPTLSTTSVCACRHQLSGFCLYLTDNESVLRIHNGSFYVLHVASTGIDTFMSVCLCELDTAPISPELLQSSNPSGKEEKGEERKEEKARKRPSPPPLLPMHPLPLSTRVQRTEIAPCFPRSFFIGLGMFVYDTQLEQCLSRRTMMNIACTRVVLLRHTCLCLNLLRLR